MKIQKSARRRLVFMINHFIYLHSYEFANLTGRKDLNKHVSGNVRSHSPFMCFYVDVIIALKFEIQI